MTADRPVLVTGATGLVGRAVLQRLGAAEQSVRAAVRSADTVLPPAVARVQVGDIHDETDWSHALRDVDVVIHLAARVHVMSKSAADSLSAYRRVNTAGTLRLGRAAAAAGARRLVYVSSIKVNGESGVVSETSPASPVDPYGVSKYEAELALARLAAESGLEVTIIRPPLVYGAGVKANFRSLVSAVRSGVPLPFGAVRNRRSLVATDNLADFIAVCARHDRAANETFLISDDHDLSTPDLVRRIAAAVGRSPRLVPVPPQILWAAASMLGRHDMAQRLLGSLEADITKARTLLDWRPPVSVEEGIARAVRP